MDAVSSVLLSLSSLPAGLRSPKHASSSTFALRCWRRTLFFIVFFLCFLLILSPSVCRSVGVGGRWGGGVVLMISGTIRRD